MWILQISSVWFKVLSWNYQTFRKHLEDLSRPPTYRVWIPDGSISFVKAIERLEKQNPGLVTASWRMIHSDKRPNGQLMIVQTDVESSRWLQEGNQRKFFFGLVWAATIKETPSKPPNSAANGIGQAATQSESIEELEDRLLNNHSWFIFEFKASHIIERNFLLELI